MYYAQTSRRQISQYSTLQVAANRVKRYIDFKTRPEFLAEFGENCYNCIDVNLYFYQNLEVDMNYFKEKLGDDQEETINHICVVFHARSEENRLERLYNNTTFWTHGESCVNILFRLLQKLGVEELAKARYDRINAEHCFSGLFVLRP